MSHKIQIRRTHTKSSGNNQGLIAPMLLLVSLLIFIPVSLMIQRSIIQASNHQLFYNVQAKNVARAGLVEAHLWFRKQSAQPVAKLAPDSDSIFKPLDTGIPETRDTLDPVIGLVKEYSLNETSHLWARFEVPRQEAGYTSFTDSSYIADAVHDISDRRIPGAKRGDGVAWSLLSRGTVYLRKDPSLPFNQAPNVVLAHSRATTEIRRLDLKLPIAAVVVNNSAGITLTTNARMNGGGVGLGLGRFNGVEIDLGSLDSSSQISGSPVQDVVTDPAALDVQGFFGVVSDQDLKRMADIVVSNVSQLPTPYPSMSLVFIDGNADFSDTGHVLQGGGILYVKGNLKLPASANTLFSGVIFVDGDVDIKAPALISGALLVKGSLKMGGLTSVAEVDYDPGIINTLVRQIGQYREDRSVTFVKGGDHS